MKADLYIKNALDFTDNSIDIAVSKGKITNIGKNLKVNAKETLDLKSKSYISAGWIDSHVHANPEMDLYYDEPDKIGIESGVTTIIDAGSTGANNIESFYQKVKRSKTNVYALLNISKNGIIEQNELDDLSKINSEKIRQVFKNDKGFVLGIKARMSRSVVGEMDLQPLVLAKKIQEANQNIPLMVHIGNAPPTLEKIIKILDKNDIVTHSFNGKENSILTVENKVHPFVKEAQKRGVIFDLGHGTDSFNMEVAEKAMKDGFKCDTISTDIYYKNRLDGPVYNMSTTMEKMLYVGYSLVEIIEKITKKPAEIFNLKNKGQLKIGYDADLTIFSMKDGKKKLMDSNGKQYFGHKIIDTEYTIVSGAINKIGD